VVKSKENIVAGGRIRSKRFRIIKRGMEIINGRNEANRTQVRVVRKRWGILTRGIR
jgi:hypothetical protein